MSSPMMVIVGETASGKSALALELARELDGEIICADSWTVRREVNIGTAKPSAAERAAVPHHLIDVVAPCGEFTAAVFKELAQAAIKDIAGRGKLPIMVGGSGLYIDSVLYDFSFLEAGDREARDELNMLSPRELVAEIQAQDIDVGGVDVRNKRRLIRLLETKGARPERSGLRTDTIIVGLRVDREELKRRMITRTDAMLASGLEQEVRHLAERYGWECEALKGVGYAQWRDYFMGSKTLEQTRDSIISATLGLAKRQRTWFQRNKSIQWFDTPVNLAKVVALITASLDKSK